MKYYWHNGQWVESTEFVRPEPVAPAIWGKLPEYVSPLSFKPIDGRSERREEMKRYGVREVDPGERPEGIGISKTQAEAAAERQQLANRDIHDVDKGVVERLKQGKPLRKQNA